MLATQRALGASTRLLRQTHAPNGPQWRSLQRQSPRHLSQHSARQTRSIAVISRRAQSTTTDAAKATADSAAKASAGAAKHTARATASGGSRVIAYLYGTGLVILLGFGFLYVTDTRASIHQYLVVPFVRFVHSDAEEAHHAGIRYIKGLYDFGLHPRERGNKDQELADLRVEVFGHILDNPIGTSAGIDKNAEVPSALFALGPAIVEVGGATPLPQEGNPKPRVFRIPSQNALINRYGLNSDGAEHVAMQLRERVRQFAYSHSLGLSAESERIVLDGEADVPPGSLVPGKLLAVQVAKNKTTPDNDIAAVARDYTFCVDHLAKYADILVVNVSSPNTPGLRDLQATAPLTAILSAVVNSAKSVDRKTKPAVMVKVSPDEDSDAQIEGICSAIWAAGVDGVIVGNTTKKRPDPLPKGYIMSAHEKQTLNEMGGYSGPQMFQRTLDLVSRYRTKLDQAPRDNSPSKSLTQKYPAQAPPVDDCKPAPTTKLESANTIDETVQRDAARLKPLTAEAEQESKQPLVQIPERHSSQDAAQQSNLIGQGSRSEVPPTESSSAFAEGINREQVLGGQGPRESAQAALDKINTHDGTDVSEKRYASATDNVPAKYKPKPAESESIARKAKDAVAKTKETAKDTLNKIVPSTDPSSTTSPTAVDTKSVASQTPKTNDLPISDPPAKVIFATGGITDGEQCLQILNAGASVCQVYTAMMYGGVGTVTRMKEEMRTAIKQQNSSNR
ncbi:Dihydroorotate dehydrogenase (quinone), mitochondrial [Fulvia fulva]|uniref:Dihydroorotate dehydrogenase (quinone), mitochondrial n=1 Tax=Passalora fulva TaxID=5499 RepID=A0A9Q8P711_PASFU|nr:Dihydroorotate dehydrogenase (quinone), mitochondrial [Fulvia fulva]KAK4629682.1 Dihydroorotate dehydrogenase (quinone), mitochondrial [Fulvia fulva]KAK4630315.1 Dihydroorotate dehydrogenase (quinone), mitochondrial [Fulvia fulva]UJO15407.1 Dihydroorotate dehydrogenase (quinone), mitochondrial [Fulvia fulva]WPV12596.1 Dihydroorotate dehydrogenase (quinone), mitochondrial [Fulvia fulva]WPV27159.1 Dihydroorotate dehydrogenase (quinone), mitochondrial [Fulvia fulva]